MAAELGATPRRRPTSPTTPSVAAMVDAALERASARLDILVNNAGVTHLPQPLEDVAEAEFDRVFAVNMKSIYLTARHLVPR